MPIRIGCGTNIQDGVVIHSKSGAEVTIGKGSSIAHLAIVHGPCVIGDDVFVGLNTVLFNCHGDGSGRRFPACRRIPCSRSAPEPLPSRRKAGLNRTPMQAQQ